MVIARRTSRWEFVTMVAIRKIETVVTFGCKSYVR